MIKKIWERYLLIEILKIFFLFIGSFCFLYALIDYSIQSKYFNQIDISFGEISLYYLCNFVKRAEILIAFALMLSTIKVLCSLNINNELVALLAGGMRIHTLLRPFIKVAVVSTVFLFLNFEWITPSALNALKEFKDTRMNEKAASKQTTHIHELPLSDNSTIIYQGYDSSTQAFFDLYWLRSSDQIFRMKYLYPHLEHPVGRYIDHLIRNTDGEFIYVESFEEKTFSDMRFDEELLRAALHPPEQQSLSQLWQHLPMNKTEMTDKEAQIATMFSYKLATPFICLLVIMGTAPFCVRFTRHLRVFLIYSVSIFSLVSYFTIMDAAVVLGETQVASPHAVIWTPFAFFSLLFGGIFSRLK